MNQKENCNNCKFEYLGTCRRYPPNIQKLDSLPGHGILQNVVRHPPISPSNWCGEYVTDFE